VYLHQNFKRWRIMNKDYENVYKINHKLMFTKYNILEDLNHENWSQCCKCQQAKNTKFKTRKENNTCVHIKRNHLCPFFGSFLKTFLWSNLWLHAINNVIWRILILYLVYYAYMLFFIEIFFLGKKILQFFIIIKV